MGKRHGEFPLLVAESPSASAGAEGRFEVCSGDAISCGWRTWAQRRFDYSHSIVAGGFEDMS